MATGASMKTTLGVALLALAVPAFAQQPEWIQVSTSTAGTNFEFLKGSFKVTPDKYGQPEVGVTERATDRLGNVSISSVVTEVSMCRQGYGVLATFADDGNGNPSSQGYYNDVVLNGTQIASVEFTVICGLYASLVT
jgi:hypothetical protein